MGCIDSCLHCLSLVPWASLIALVLCWAGTALFSGAGHSALSNTFDLLNESNIEGIDITSLMKLTQDLKYSIYGISAFIFLLTILLFVDGLMSTRAVKNDYDAGCKSTCWGLFTGIILTVFTYLSGIGWLLITCGVTLPVYFYLVSNSQCSAVSEATNKEDFCLYFTQTGLVLPGQGGKLCGNDLQMLCENSQYKLTEQLYMITLIGAIAALVSMKQFLMSLSANYAYSKMIKKLSIYEDAKYREEMELNDIINTARSNERLTYKY